MTARVPTSSPPEHLGPLIEELAERLWMAAKPMATPPILLGIPKRGYFLAQRIARLWKERKNQSPIVGQIDITFHRDDYGQYLPEAHSTMIMGPIDQRHIILIDDVFHTGRTARAALEAIHALGRPASVLLAVLIDRGGRELPIVPDIVVRTVTLASHDKIKIKISEVDGEDAIHILKQNHESLAPQRFDQHSRS